MITTESCTPSLTSNSLAPLRYSNYILSFLLAGCLACTEPSPKESTNVPQDYTLPPAHPLQDATWFSELTYIPLCTDDITLQIRDIQRVRIHEGHVYVLDMTGIERRLFKFSMDGELQALIRGEADGTNRFYSVSDFAFVEDSIYLLDISVNRLLVYDTAFTYHRSLSLLGEESVRNFFYLPERDSFLFRRRRPYGHPSSVFTTGRDFASIHNVPGAEAYTEIAGADYPLGLFTNFVPAPGGLLYTDLFSSTIWRLTDAGFEQAFTIDFEDEVWMTDAEIQRMPPRDEAAQRAVQRASAKAFHFDQVLAGDDYIVLSFTKPGRRYFVRVDETGNANGAYIPLPMPADESNGIDGGPPLTYLVGTDGDRLIFQVDMERVQAGGRPARIDLPTDDLSCGKVLILARLR